MGVSQTIKDAIEKLKSLNLKEVDISDVKDMWIRKSDSFTAFCYDHVEEKEYATITKKQLRKMYHKYTKKHKVSGCSDKAIHITLENMFGISESQNSNFDRIWDGIQLKNVEEL